MSDPDSSIFPSVLILLILMVCHAVLAMSETAIITLNDNKVRKMAQEGNKTAGLIVRLTKEPSRFLSTIRVGATLSGFLASAMAVSGFTQYLVRAFIGVSIPASALRGISIVVITVLLSYILLVFSELARRVAMQNYERIAFSVARMIVLVAAVLRPAVKLLSATTSGLLRLAGIDPNARPEEVTEEEIRMMIDVGGESGTIEQAEKDMLNNIFEFDDATADEMMTHRTEITAVELGASLDEVVAIVEESGHSRIPVYEESLDSIVGILYAKDLLGLITRQPETAFDLRDYMRIPMYVLESTRSAALLAEFQEKKIQIAVVIDEYGGTSGLVTMEDLLEGIVGNIQDEYDDEEEDITAIGENRYLVDGLAPLDDVLKYFGLELEDEDDYDTIGGYVTNILGYIPGENDHSGVMVGGVRFTVREMDERRIAKLLAEVYVPEEGPETALKPREA